MHTPKSECVPAKDIPEGGFFKKRGGSFIYLRLSDASVKFLKLDTTKVYGAHDNGNVTVVDADLLVAPMTLRQFTMRYGAADCEWNRIIAHRCGKCMACIHNQPCFDPP